MRNVSPPVRPEQTAALLTPRQAAEILGLAEPTLRRWRHEGRGPAFVKLSPSVVRYRAADVEAFVGPAFGSAHEAKAAAALAVLAVAS